MASPKIKVGGRTYDLDRQLLGRAEQIVGDCERVRLLMADFSRYVRQDDGHGIGDAPRHAIEALEHALDYARDVKRMTDEHRSHFYRKAKSNPPRRSGWRPEWKRRR